MVPQELQVEDLHIFVNRRKFEEGDGVQSEMTGRQIAALVNVPAENAIVRVESVPSPGEVDIVVETSPDQGEVDVVVETGPDQGEVDVVVETGPDQGEVDVVVETGPDQGEVDVVVETGPDQGEVDVVVETGPNPGEEVGLDTVIAIINGMHFLVTRRIVEGG